MTSRLVIASQVIIVGVGCVGGVPLEGPVGGAAGRHHVVEGLLQQGARVGRGGGRGRAPGAAVHPAQSRPQGVTHAAHRAEHFITIINPCLDFLLQLRLVWLPAVAARCEGEP